jgi:hypothetical protein
MEEDFRTLPLGAMVEGKPVEVCPWCRLHGIWMGESSERAFTHGFIVSQTRHGLTRYWTPCTPK